MREGRCMKVLSNEQVNNVTGGFANFAFGAGVGLIGYMWSHDFNFKEMSWSGAVLATGTGAITGGLGGAAIKAAGGGIAANVAWRPGFVGLNFGVQKAISSNK